MKNLAILLLLLSITSLNGNENISEILNQNYPMPEFPLEIQQNIASFLITSIKETIPSLNALSQVNKQWNAAINDESFTKKVAQELNISPYLLKLYKSQNNTQLKQMITQLSADKHQLYKTYQDARYINFEFNNNKNMTLLTFLKCKICQLFYTDDEQVHWVYPDNSYLTQRIKSYSLILSVKSIHNKLDYSFGGGCYDVESSNKLKKRGGNIDGRVEICNIRRFGGEEPCVALQSNKKIVIGLASKEKKLILIRLDKDGKLDTNFAESGTIDTKIKYSEDDSNLYYTVGRPVLEDIIINPQTNDIIFKAKGIVKKYTADGKEIQ
ncbi:MAG: F-box protein [Candidatus Dependentiae bacterium]